MNGFDRSSIVRLMSGWNAVTRQGVTGEQRRLSGVPNRISINKETTSRLSTQSSRSSRLSCSNEIKPVEDVGAILDASIVGQDLLPTLLQQDIFATGKSQVVEGQIETNAERMCMI
mmetsp:Transcript_75328/g.118974  ORF Transcript_75328/g.118974 Transcript_75328/m.118974 type:complete len:116 (-) Transcript_75328:96-443(-)